MTILSTGEVSVCCRDYSGDLVYADAATDDLEAALNSEKIVRLRKLSFSPSTARRFI